jgi:DNA-binding NarL/FixJ family response regulator
MVPLRLTPPILPLDLTFKQGADVGVVLTVVDATGQPIQNTTGYSIRAQIRSTSGGLVLFEWDSAGGVGIGAATLTYTAQPPLSVVTLLVTNAQSSAFVFMAAQWDCYLTSPTNQEVCLAEGVVSIDPSITHS